MSMKQEGFQPAILVVDDEPEMVEVLLEDLKSMVGMRLFSAGNVEEALHCIENNNINAILSDITMPGRTGIDFCRMIRAKGHDVPFVFLTAYENVDNLRAAIGLGATDFLEKPYDKSHLIDVLWKSIYIGQKQEQINTAVNTLADGHENGKDLKKLIESERKRIGLVKAAKTKTKKVS